MNTELPRGEARCAVHLDNPAQGTCARCGNFVCYLDTEGEKFTTCASCRARTLEGVFPLTRANYTFDALFAYSWRVFKQHWLMLTAGIIVVLTLALVAMIGGSFAVLFAVGAKDLLVGGVKGWRQATENMRTSPLGIVLQFANSFVAYFLLTGLFTGFFRFAQDLQQGRSPQFGRFFSGFARPGRIAVVVLLMTAVVFAVSRGIYFFTASSLDDVRRGVPSAISRMLVATYGTYFVLYLLTLPWLWFLYPELALTDAGPIAALGNCWKIARGFYLQMLLLTVVWIALSLAGTVACCIGLLPAMAFIYLMTANLHRALRIGADGLIGAEVSD